eukprot:scaffold21347_cov54-Attheya_sp.AAC.5
MPEQLKEHWWSKYVEYCSEWIQWCCFVTKIAHVQYCKWLLSQNKQIMVASDKLPTEEDTEILGYEM